MQAIYMTESRSASNGNETVIWLYAITQSNTKSINQPIDHFSFYSVFILKHKFKKCENCSTVSPADEFRERVLNIQSSYSECSVSKLGPSP